MIGGLIAFVAEKRTTLHLGLLDKPTQHIQLSQNEVVDIGFKIQLKSFSVSHYDPDLIHYKDEALQKVHRISSGKNLNIDNTKITINKISNNTVVKSYELDGAPQLLIYNDNALWKQIAVTGEVDSITMPDDTTLMISRSYNNLPTMQNNNFIESDYPTNPGLILRQISGEKMSILTLPAGGEVSLLSARDLVKLPDIRYHFPSIKNIELAEDTKSGVSAVNITIGSNSASTSKTVTLLQDGGMLSRITLPDNSVIQLSNPIDRQYHAEIEIDDLNGGKRTAMLGTNHPIDEQGWRFYLNSYDNKGIIVTARNDPGNTIVVIGILAVMIGMPLIFFFRKRRIY